jgi:hypothetical protein
MMGLDNEMAFKGVAALNGLIKLIKWGMGIHSS